MIKLSGFKKVLPWVSVALGLIWLILFVIIMSGMTTRVPNCFMCDPPYIIWDYWDYWDFIEFSVYYSICAPIVGLISGLLGLKLSGFSNKRVSCWGIRLSIINIIIFAIFVAIVYLL